MFYNINFFAFFSIILSALVVLNVFYAIFTIKNGYAIKKVIGQLANTNQTLARQTEELTDLTCTIKKLITTTAHKLQINQILGLNQIKGVYFHPENGKIVETKNYTKPFDGPVEEILPCMFKFFQQIKLNDSSFFLKIKEFLSTQN